MIAVANENDDGLLFEAVRTGAAALAMGDLEPTGLAALVLDQFRYLPAGRGLVEEGLFAPLTDQEVEVLDCMARGMSNKEIANALVVSAGTVKNLVTSILRKLAVNDRTEAVLHTIRCGWVRLPRIGPGSLPGEEVTGP